MDMLSSRLSSIRSVASDPEAARSVRQHGTHAPSAIRARVLFAPSTIVCALSLSPSIDMYLLSAHFRATTVQYPHVDGLILEVLFGDHLADPIQSSLEVHPRKHLANAKRREGMRGEVVKSALAAYLFNVAIVGDEGLSLMGAVPRRPALIFTAIPRPQ